VVAAFIGNGSRLKNQQGHWRVDQTRSGRIRLDKPWEHGFEEGAITLAPSLKKADVQREMRRQISVDFRPMSMTGMNRNAWRSL
jgi:hypothetical protein